MSCFALWMITYSLRIMQMERQTVSMDLVAIGQASNFQPWVDHCHIGCLCFGGHCSTSTCEGADKSQLGITFGRSGNQLIPWEHHEHFLVCLAGMGLGVAGSIQGRKVPRLAKYNTPNTNLLVPLAILSLHAFFYHDLVLQSNFSTIEQ